MNVLAVSEISKKIGDEVVLKNISFNQKTFQKIAIAGETGSGKSTLLKVIAGLVQTDAGEVWFENERVLGPEEKLIPGHPRIAYLSQYFELRNHYRVEELLDMANKISPDHAEKIYSVCRISHLLHRKTNELSGGEKQRIATARLLVTAPMLLLLDEPYSNLDALHKRILKEVIHDIAEELKITCIMVSHDPVDTLSWADEIIVMKDGEIVQKGTPEEVYTKPVDEYTAGLFGSYNLLQHDLAASFNSPVEKVAGKRMFSRPENFLLVQDEQHAVLAEVTGVRFFGGYYEIEIMAEESLITVKSLKTSVAKGDLVYVAFDGADHWYL
jgi:ABC-type sugar transport system ATPase subunit